MNFYKLYSLLCGYNFFMINDSILDDRLIIQIYFNLTKSLSQSFEMKHSYRNHTPKNRSPNRSTQKEHNYKSYKYRSRSRNDRQPRNHHQKDGNIGYQHKKYCRRRSYSSQSSSSSSSESSSYTSNSSENYQSNKSVKIITSGSTEKRRNARHYRYQKGQKIGHKYKITQILGDGTFGRVVKGESDGKSYAIKIIKPVQKYIKSAKIEKNILKQINEEDYRDQYGIVKVLQSFYHRNYYCIVFQSLGSSMYDIIKKNKYKGFPRTLVKKFFYQILKTMKFIHRIGYTHTDLKPENILFVQNDFQTRYNYRGAKQYSYPKNTKLKVIDFGSATKYDDHHSSMINTRQYRSPQVILSSCKWNQISDVWSIGCIIIELYTGELFFDTHQDPQHLAMIQKNSGLFPKWMIQDSRNEQLSDLFSLKSGRIKQNKLRKYVGEGQNTIGMKTVHQIFDHDKDLANLLMRCLQIDPQKRISCQEALKDPYFDDADY